MRNLFLLLFLFIVSINCKADAADMDNMDYLEKPITLSFNQSELSSVLKNMADASGIQIIYDENISTKIVSGVFVEEPLRIVINRLLKGMNHSLTLDHEKKTLLIKSFGETQYATTQKVVDESVTGASLINKDLNTSYAEQVKEFDQKLKDKVIFLDEAEMSQGDLEMTYDEQVASFNESINNPNEIDPETGLTREEVATIYEEQVSQINQNKDTLTTFSEESSTTVEALEKEYKEQLAVFTQKQKNGNEYIEEIGMTIKESNRIYSEEIERFNSSLSRELQ